MFKADLCLNKNSIKLKKGFIYCLYKFMMFTENVVENKIFIPKNIKKTKPKEGVSRLFIFMCSNKLGVKK